MSSGTDDSQLGQPKANVSSLSLCELSLIPDRLKSIFTLPNEHINIDSMHSNSSNKVSGKASVFIIFDVVLEKTQFA